MVGFNKNIILCLLVFFVSCSPLQAMDDEGEDKKITKPLRSNVVANEERTFPPFKSVVLNAGANALLGIGYICAGEWFGRQLRRDLPYYDQYNFDSSVRLVEIPYVDYSTEIVPLQWCLLGSTAVGAKFLVSAMRDLGFYLYVITKEALIQKRVADLNLELNKKTKKTKKKKEVKETNKGKNQIRLQQINNLLNQDPREEARLFFRAFDNALEVALAPLWIAHFSLTMYLNWEDFGSLYTFFPEFDPSIVASNKFNFVTICFSFISLGCSVKDLRSYLKGDPMGPNSPVRSFLKAFSGVSTARAFDLIGMYKILNYLIENNITIPESGTGIALLNLPPQTLIETLIERLHRCFYCLRIGESLEHLLKALKLVYDEREYWFGLVDELANDGSTPTELQKYQVIQPETKLTEDKKIQNKLPVQKQKNPVFSNPVSTYDSFDSGNHSRPDTILPKKFKIKTRGVPYKQGKETTENNSDDFQPVVASGNEDGDRRKKLSEIQEMRSRPSVNKKEINKLLNDALRFVEGKVENAGKNKVIIKWERGKRERSVFFENPHKQPNDKPSAFTGYKLRMALDSLEQAYLDGWDEKNIVDHLNNRFNLYNLPHRLYEVLWTDLGEK